MDETKYTQNEGRTLEDLGKTRDVLHAKVDVVILNLSKDKATTLTEFVEFAQNTVDGPTKTLIKNLVTGEVARLYENQEKLRKDEIEHLKKLFFNEFREKYNLESEPEDDANSESSYESSEEGSKISNFIDDNTPEEPVTETGTTGSAEFDTINENMGEVCKQVKKCTSTVDEVRNDIELLAQELETQDERIDKIESTLDKGLSANNKKLSTMESQVGLLEDLNPGIAWKLWEYGSSERQHSLASEIMMENILNEGSTTLAKFAIVVLEIKSKPHEQTLIWAETLIKGKEAEKKIQVDFLMSQILNILGYLVTHTCTVTQPKKSSIAGQLGEILCVAEALRLQKAPIFQELFVLKKRVIEIDTISSLLQALGDGLPNYYGRRCLTRRSELTMKVRDLPTPSAGPSNIPKDENANNIDLPSESDEDETPRNREEKLVESFKCQKKTLSEPSTEEGPPKKKQKIKKPKQAKETVAEFIAKRRAKALDKVKV